MSRAIDADALMKALYHRAFETDEDTMWQSGCWVRYRAIEQTVKEQPTIEPERKKGRWVRITQGAIPEKYMCPFCHRTIENDGVESLLSMRFPFCHCGADMREGEQNG